MPTALKTPQTPMVNLGDVYINGMQLSWLSNSTLSVAPGQARDSTDSNDLQLPASITIAGVPTAQTYVVSTARAGALGLDVLPTAGIAASTLYYVYVIGNSANNNPAQPGFNVDNLPSVCLSLSATAPALPRGYDMYRRIGAVRTDATAAPSHIIPFSQRGNDSNRTMYYNTGTAALTVLTAGAATAFAIVDVSAVVPPEATLVIFDAALTPAAAGNLVSLRATGSASTGGYARMSGDVAAVVHVDDMTCPCSSIAGVTSVDYLVTGGAVTLAVAGYVDQL